MGFTGMMTATIPMRTAHYDLGHIYNRTPVIVPKDL